jgi:hypothetical protein
VAFWNAWPLAVVLVGFAMQFFDGDRLWRVWHRLAAWPSWVLGATAAVVLTIILALGPEGVAPFIYFQF